MITEKELDGLLQHWADEFGGGKYEWLGYSRSNVLQRMMEHEGFVPQSGGFKKPPIRTRANDVEDIIQEMLNSDWRNAANILRCEYFKPNHPFEAKQDALKKVGIQVGRTRYNELLNSAKAYVAAGLNGRVS